MSMENRDKLLENTNEQVEFFSALADPTRLKLLKLLQRQRYPDALCVNALAALLGVTQSAVSQHLRVLKAIGLVEGERQGYHIHYFINQDILEKFRKLVSATLSTEETVEEQSCAKYCPKSRKQNVSSS